MDSNTVTAIVEEITERTKRLLDIEAEKAEKLKETEHKSNHWRQNYYFMKEKWQTAEAKVLTLEDEWQKTKDHLQVANKELAEEDDELTNLDNKNTGLEKEVTELVDKVYILRKDNERMLQEKAAADLQESSMQNEYRDLVSELAEATIRGDLNPTKELRDFLLVKAVYSVDQ